MHIASGLPPVKRTSAQSGIADGHPEPPPALAWRWTPDRVDATRARLGKMLPGAILLAVLVLFGALFPIVF
jgi:hypothetical protein